MHVYTMGTRAYALKVCNAIDPTGALFNERILTRDESGSESVHNYSTCVVLKSHGSRYDAEEHRATVPVQQQYGRDY